MSQPPPNMPDRLDSWKEIAAYLRRSVLTVQRWEKTEGLPVRRHAHGKQDSVYAYRSEVDGWWDNRGSAAPAKEPTPLREQAERLRKPLRLPPGWSGRNVLIPATAIVILLLAVAAWQVRAANVRWARNRALPTIERTIKLDSSSATLFAAYRLATQADRYISDDAELRKIWPVVSRTINIVVEPPGVDIFVSSYSGGDSLRYAISSSRQIRVPRGSQRWQASKDGYESAEGVLDTSTESLHVVLDGIGSRPAGMIRAPGGEFMFGLTHMGDHPAFELTDYWIDKYEVTNRNFKTFVEAGGYADPKYWKQPFRDSERELSFAEAMVRFRDRTGRAGPATWEAGDFPEGKGDYPVTGVSWFEAMAYAEFAGKSLPTIFHWVRAASVWGNSEIVPLSNFSGSGLAPVRQYRGISAVGTFDMAGNAKEWCLNKTAGGRFILGGAWNEPLYMFNEADAQPPFSRADNFGFRLIKYIAPPAPSLIGEVDYPRRDFSKEQPVSDAVFKVIRDFYTYDQLPLHATIDATDDSDEHWRKQKVSFDAAYGGERMIAYVFLPRHLPPPCQTVVVFPGSSNILVRSSRDLAPPYDGATIKSGRALVYPIYKGTFDRGDALVTDYPAQTDLYREHLLDWYKDLARTLDYIETRSDLDATRIAYFGLSWGARLGPIFLARDARLKVALLVGGGLKFARTFPEADPFNFAPRVTVPVLMVNGKYDYFFPLETSQQPLFQLLGTPAEHKRHVVLDSGHIPPESPVIREMLEWLDRYLGPVRH